MPDGYRIPDETKLTAEFPMRRPEPVESADDGEATMTEEPIEHRLRRAWLNGFKEGVGRSAYAAAEATGRWDY